MNLKKVLPLTFAMVLSTATVSFANPAPPHSSNTSKSVNMHQVKGSKLLSNLHQKMPEVDEQEKIPVIITFKTLNQESNLQRAKASVQSFTPRHIYKNIPAMSTKLTRSQIKSLEQSSDVKQIEYDEKVHSFMDTARTSYGTEQASKEFGLTGDRDGNETAYSKEDVTVAVIDTEIDPSHADLDGGKVIGWKDYINNRTTPYDDQGHGTHVSSIVAGSGDGNATYHGVAKGASLVGVKVLDKEGSGSLSDTTAGIDWAISNKSTYGIDIISMSLGSNGSSDGTDASSLAVNKAVDAGITVVVAAGNSGPNAQTVGSPGAAEKAITVGAMADIGKNGFFLAYFSSRGPTQDDRIKPDIAAPGYKIMAAKANTNNEYVAYSGTSMATPFVSGTVALLLDAKPDLSPAQVRSIITSTATDMGTTGADNEYGAGNLNGYEAIKKAGGFQGNSYTLPDHYFAQGSLPNNAQDTWTFDVNNTDKPIAITLIIPKKGFLQRIDLALIDPSGNQVAESTTGKRQETIGFAPKVVGKYKIVLKSKWGKSDYYFDLSTNGSNLTKSTNK